MTIQEATRHMVASCGSNVKILTVFMLIGSFPFDISYRDYSSMTF